MAVDLCLRSHRTIGNYGTYLLDDQATAKKYEGQRVVVTGTLDATHNTIHVRKIEAVA